MLTLILAATSAAAVETIDERQDLAVVFQEQGLRAPLCFMARRDGSSKGRRSSDDGPDGWRSVDRFMGSRRTSMSSAEDAPNRIALGRALLWRLGILEAATPQS
jgi:hypothetical protein